MELARFIVAVMESFIIVQIVYFSVIRRKILEDIVGFRSYPVYLTDEEAKEMMLEIRKSIFKRVENKKTFNSICTNK